MLHDIPTHIIAGPLGAGKTSVIRQLLNQRPVHERWAVLINEFGQIGLDAALLARADDGVQIAEVAGGCLCCVNGVPFQVGLGRLLRQIKPHRLFIEPSGLGHPLQLTRQLQQAPWTGVLSLQPLTVVLDGMAHAWGEPLSPEQREACDAAGLVVINKSAGLSDAARHGLIGRFPQARVLWTEYGELALSELASPDARTVETEHLESLAVTGTVTDRPLWISPSKPLCMIHEDVNNWSVGWKWHPDRTFDLERVVALLDSLSWVRAKGVIHSSQGWMAFNAVPGEAVPWQASEWRQDTRIELIFTETQTADMLTNAWCTCLVG